MEFEDLITQSEAAEIKGVSLQVVNNWVRRGHIEGFSKFGKVLVSRKEILAFEPNPDGRPLNMSKPKENDKTKATGARLAPKKKDK